eukprot:TRINITY_DN15604_c0_g1_i1.p2 TRINITY_DN15604_c0_g1~~TRINITY_DN15604_c0_g1_i1.p2  ORF type:complete len:122 (-),score=19.41 TRINITY_DN15604_c0_g1_i1:109-474(-)
MFLYPWSLLKNNDKWSTDLSPELQPMDNAHPVSFFAQNSDDATAYVQNTLQYNLKLMAAGAPNPTTHIYPKGGHAFGLCQGVKSFEQVCDWPLAARRFVQDIGVAPGFPSIPARDNDTSVD